MLCTFTTEQGNLVIRSDDIRSIYDHEGHARLAYMMGDAIYYAAVVGTAAENRDRLSQEEFDLMAKIETQRYQLQMLLQAQPTPRGRQAK